MNSAGNNLFSRATGNANTIGSIVSNSSSSSSIFVIIGIVLLVVLGAVWLAYYSWAESPWWSDRFAAAFHVWDWLPSWTTTASLGEMGELSKREIVEEKPVRPVVNESWCFVGEDLMGRWCVKVPSASACDPERFFESRSECELVQANHLPAGLVKNNGADMTPLSSVHTM